MSTLPDPILTVDPRDWETRRLPFNILDRQFTPQYAGDSFPRAADVAKRTRAGLWERDSARGWFVVSFGCPPYLLTEEPDPAWSRY